MTQLAVPRSLGIPAVALVAVAIAATLLFPRGPGLSYWGSAAAIVLLSVWIAWQDLTDFTIPDAAVVALACLGLVGRLAEAPAGGADLLDRIVTLAADFVLAGGSLLAVREVYFRRRGIDGLGLGDVKLGAAGGLLVGVTPFAIALLAASLAGLVLVGRERWRAGSFDPRQRIAFGAMLAPSLTVVWLAQTSWGIRP